MISTDLSTRAGDGYAVVALRGELDLADAAVVADALTAVAAAEPVIVVDLTGLEFIDSSGVAALARGRRQARRAGGDLALVAPRGNVMRVLAITRLVEAFAVYATVEEAAREAGHDADRAAPEPRPRPRQRPAAALWSGTRNLWALHGNRTPPGPGPGPGPAAFRLPRRWRREKERERRGRGKHAGRSRRQAPGQGTPRG